MGFSLRGALTGAIAGGAGASRGMMNAALFRNQLEEKAYNRRVAEAMNRATIELKESQEELIEARTAELKKEDEKEIKGHWATEKGEDGYYHLYHTGTGKHKLMVDSEGNPVRFPPDKKDTEEDKLSEKLSGALEERMKASQKARADQQKRIDTLDKELIKYEGSPDMEEQRKAGNIKKRIQKLKLEMPAEWKPSAEDVKAMSDSLASSDPTMQAGVKIFQPKPAAQPATSWPPGSPWDEQLQKPQPQPIPEEEIFQQPAHFDNRIEEYRKLGWLKGAGQ